MKLARTAVFEGDLVLNVSNCTFVGNSSEAGSVMFQSYDQPAWINQSILWESGYQPVYSTYGYVKVVASLYDEYGGMDKLAKAGYEELEFGNFYAPPMFKDPENGDYSLLPGSPCIDGGNPLGWKDPDGTRADVGAFVTKQDRPNKIVLKPTKASPGGKTRLMVYGTIVSADSLLVNIALPSYIIDSFTVITSVVDTMTNPVVMKSLDEGDMRVVLKSDGKIAITDQPILELELTINDYFGDWTQTMYIDPRYTRVDTNKAAMYDAKIIIGPIYGDASLNAEVTALDAAWVLQQRVGKRDDVDPRNADVTGNEGLSALDASLIMRKVLDPKFEFPIQNMTVIYRKPAVGARVLSIQKDAISDGWLLGIDDATGVLSGEVVLDIPGTDAVTISGEGMTASSRTGTTVRVAFARLEPGTPVLFTIGTGEDVTPRIISAQLNEGAISVSMRPLSLALKQNVPNPFNPITSITFSLPEHGPASLVVYNQLGQVVRVLADGTLTAGFHHIVWNGRDRTGRNVGSGVYIYRLKTARSALVKRMTLVR